MVDLKEREFSKNSLLYIIEAKKKFVDLNKVRHFSFFNLHKKVAESIYYIDGTFHLNGINITFKKAYFFGGDFYMRECHATTKDSYIDAQSAIYKTTTIEFKQLILKKNNKIFHKIKYIYPISQL